MWLSQCWQDIGHISVTLIIVRSLTWHTLHWDTLITWELLKILHYLPPRRVTPNSSTPKGRTVKKILFQQRRSALFLVSTVYYRCKYPSPSLVKCIFNTSQPIHKTVAGKSVTDTIHRQLSQNNRPSPVLTFGFCSRTHCPPHPDERETLRRVWRATWTYTIQAVCFPPRRHWKTFPLRSEPLIGINRVSQSLKPQSDIW
jgi:hypothetical protein